MAGEGVAIVLKHGRSNPARTFFYLIVRVFFPILPLYGLTWRPFQYNNTTILFFCVLRLASAPSGSSYPMAPYSTSRHSFPLYPILAMLPRFGT
jgi:hypothetical protein